MCADTQAADFLRLVASDGQVSPNLERYRRPIRSAMEILGSESRRATYRTVEKGMPVSAEISRKVIPAERRAAICDEGVIVPPIEQKNAPFVKQEIAPPDERERQIAILSRQNARMTERDPDKERQLSEPGVPIGERLRYFIAVRDVTHAELASRVGYNSGGTIRAILEGKTKKGKQLHEIAAALQISAKWLITGQGSPDLRSSANAPTPLPVRSQSERWPFPKTTAADLADLDEVELGFLDLELSRALEKIRSRRKQRAG